MNITRRRFVAIAGATAVALVTAPLILRRETDVVIGMLHKHLPSLRMNHDRLTVFAEAFLLDYKSTGLLKRTTILTGARMVETLPVTVGDNFLPDLIKSPIQNLEQEVFRAFFLGTDYLEVYDDPERIVSFLFIPDPYDVGCANRLARYDA